MKKLFILFCLFVASDVALAQTYLPLTGGSLTGNLVVEGAGSGRINLFNAYSGSPANPGFEIRNYAGNLTFQHNSNGATTNLYGTLNVSGHVDLSGDLTLSDSRKVYGAYFQTTDYSTMTFQSRAWATVQGTNGKAFSFLTHSNAGGGGFEMLAIYYGESGKITMVPNGGNVGIGTSTPAEKLSVNGNIRAKEVKVETANWPDYVFEEGYKIEKLEALESFIKANKHLPGIPSAKEVEKEGISLGEMNAKLLQKIEEMTLHLIEQNNQIKQLRKEVLALKKIK